MPVTSSDWSRSSPSCPTCPASRISSASSISTLQPSPTPAPASPFPTNACTTSRRTYEQLEPEADMHWELFTSLIDQYPNIARVVLHGIGEPMLVKDLAQRVKYLKDRHIYVLFNTNGTLLTKANGRALIEAGLDELRVSLDAAESTVFQMVRGKDFFSKIVANVKNFTTMQRELDAPKPRVSLWLTGLRETVDQLPNFVRLAHSIGVTEVYLQRLVFFEDPMSKDSLARAES